MIEERELYASGDDEQGNNLSADGSGSGSGSSNGSSSGEQGSSSRRPPSYASEDGVTYIIEARPRSIAPLATEIIPMPSPLPVHPSEVGRLATPPSN